MTPVLNYSSMDKQSVPIFTGQALDFSNKLEQAHHRDTAYLNSKEKVQEEMKLAFGTKIEQLMDNHTETALGVRQFEQAKSSFDDTADLPPEKVQAYIASLQEAFGRAYVPIFPFLLDSIKTMAEAEEYGQVVRAYAEGQIRHELSHNVINEEEFLYEVLERSLISSKTLLQNFFGEELAQQYTDLGPLTYIGKPLEDYVPKLRNLIQKPGRDTLQVIMDIIKEDLDPEILRAIDGKDEEELVVETFAGTVATNDTTPPLYMPMKQVSAKNRRYNERAEKHNKKVFDNLLEIYREDLHEILGTIVSIDRIEARFDLFRDRIWDIVTMAPDSLYGSDEEKFVDRSVYEHVMATMEKFSIDLADNPTDELYRILRDATNHMKKGRHTFLPAQKNLLMQLFSAVENIRSALGILVEKEFMKQVSSTQELTEEDITRKKLHAKEKILKKWTVEMKLNFVYSEEDRDLSFVEVEFDLLRGNKSYFGDGEYSTIDYLYERLHRTYEDRNQASEEENGSLLEEVTSL